MGYNVSASAEVTILAGDEAKALRALGNIAWARPVSSRLCEALEELGCESAWPGEDRRGLAGFEWNGKWGDTLDTILDVIAPLAQPGGRVVWEGEDGALWEWRLEDGGWVAGVAHTVTDLFDAVSELEEERDVSRAYSTYVQTAFEAGLPEAGWCPVCVDEFREAEYRNVWLGRSAGENPFEYMFGDRDDGDDGARDGLDVVASSSSVAYDGAEPALRTPRGEEDAR